MKFNLIIFLITLGFVECFYLQTELITKFRPIFFEESYNFINFTTYCYFEGNKTFFSEELLKFIIGLMGFLFAGHYFFFKKNKEAKSDKNFLKGGVCSTIAGFTSFCVHAGGTPTSLYLLPLRMKKEIYVGTRIIFFTCLNLFKLPLYINLSMTNLDSFKNSLILFPLALIGILIGYRLIKIIEEKLFYNILYTLIFVTSTKLLYDYLI